MQMLIHLILVLVTDTLPWAGRRFNRRWHNEGRNEACNEWCCSPPV